MNDGMSQADRMRISRLESEIADLKRKLSPSSGLGPGVSTANGALNFRTTQLGFPAEITSTYDSVTGYSWKQLALQTTATAGLVNPSIQLTGNKAFEVGGTTSFSSGQRAWLEPDQESKGYLFQVDPAAVPSSGFFARLTSAAGSVWKWVKLKWNGSAWVDDGSESISYTAARLPLWPSTWPEPRANERVWMNPSQTAGYYEFLPAVLPWIRQAVLTETTEPDSWTERICSSGTWSNGSISGTDNAYPVEMDGAKMVPKPTAKILLFPGLGGHYEFLPVQSADKVSSTYYAGYVSTGDQTWSGNKTIDGGLEINWDGSGGVLSVLGGGATMIAGGSYSVSGGSVIATATVTPFSDESNYLTYPSFTGTFGHNTAYVEMGAAAGGGCRFGPHPSETTAGGRVFYCPTGVAVEYGIDVSGGYKASGVPGESYTVSLGGTASLTFTNGILTGHTT